MMWWAADLRIQSTNNQTSHGEFNTWYVTQMAEKAMASHSSTLAWKIPWVEEPAVHGVAKSQTRLSDFTFTFHFHALEKEMATHSSVLAWRIPGAGEPGGLPSMGSHRVRHDWSDLAACDSDGGNDLNIRLETAPRPRSHVLWLPLSPLHSTDFYLKK